MYSKKTKDMATLSSSIVKCTLPAKPATAESFIVGQEYSHIELHYMQQVTFKKMSSNQVINLSVSKYRWKINWISPHVLLYLLKECADGRPVLFGKTK